MVACKHFYKAKCPSSKYHLYFLVWYACGLFRREKCGICDTIKDRDCQKVKKKGEQNINRSGTRIASSYLSTDS